jgi:hypothetical protein
LDQQLPRERIVAGQVVRLWITKGTRKQTKEARFYHCCVDDGTSAEGWSLEISRADYQKLRVGDSVKVRLSPRWKAVYAITQVPSGGPAPR